MGIKQKEELIHMEYVLETDALIKRYRHFTALNGLTMHIPKGAIYGLVGRNGAGKTTLIRLICGLQAPDSGTYTLYGTKHTDTGICRARRRMGAVVETPAVYLDMTAADNIRQQYQILGRPSEDGIAELLHLVGLADTGTKKVRNFSKVIRTLDVTALRRIFENILNNAVKYTDGDLTVVLQPDGSVSFANHAANLSRVQTAHLFDRFFTVESANRSTGIGLSIAKSLTEKMNGTIHAAYQSGILRVCVHFPA